MSEQLLGQLVVAVGPTLVGLAALRQATLSKREAAAANRAVNHQGPDEPSLVEKVTSIDKRTAGMVDEMRTLSDGHDELNRGLTGCAVAIGEVGHKVDRHLAFHQEQREQHRSERAADEQRRTT